MIARSRADRMIAPVILTHGKDKWTIADTAVRSWVSFGAWPDGSYGPLVDPAKVETAVKALSKKIDSAGRVGDVLHVARAAGSSGSSRPRSVAS